MPRFSHLQTYSDIQKTETTFRNWDLKIVREKNRKILRKNKNKYYDVK